MVSYKAQREETLKASPRDSDTTEQSGKGISFSRPDHGLISVSPQTAVPPRGSRTVSTSRCWMGLSFIFVW